VIRFAVGLCLVLLAQVCDAADDFEPRVCASAVEYAGPPLHAGVATEVFAAIAPELQGELDPALAARLSDAVDWILKNTPAPGITAAVGIPGKGIWSTSRGLALVEPPTPLQENAYFHWASAGKAFTAAVVMQLIEEGKLGYGDPLAKWFPKFPNAGAITIDHLLTHTNGIFSFNADLQFHKQRGYQSPEKCLAVAERHGCVSCPGERWYYSNTGYVLLARIIEEVEARPFHEVVTGRIIQRLKLAQTIAMAPKRPPASLATGHVNRKPDADFEPTTPFGAGNIAASAHDMVVFWHAYLTGKLLSKPAVEQAFARLYPMFDAGTFYGRGVMLYEFPSKEGQTSIWLGHSGGTPGLKSVIAYDINSKTCVAVAINGNVSAEAAANKLLTEVKDVRSAR